MTCICHVSQSSDVCWALLIHAITELVRILDSNYPLITSDRNSMFTCLGCLILSDSVIYVLHHKDNYVRLWSGSHGLPY